MNKSFEYKPIDEQGEGTLEAISKAHHFNQWMYDTIKPYCSGNILEIGSGIGNISQFFLMDNASIFLTDIRDVYCEKLKEQFSNYTYLLGIESIDLVDPQFDSKYSKYFESFDTVFSLNVIEHIEKDNLAITNAHKLLKPGGTLLLLAPAYQWLYNGFDKGLEHYKRYNKQSLIQLLLSQNFKLTHSQYFNFAGIGGWFIFGLIQRNKQITEGKMSAYNKLVPVFKLIDKLLFNSMGLSVIVVGRKQ